MATIREDLAFPTISPEITLPEVMNPDLGGVKVGQKIKATVSYEVIEKTRNFLIIKVNGISIIKSRRTF